MANTEPKPCLRQFLDFSVLGDRTSRRIVEQATTVRQPGLIELACARCLVMMTVEEDEIVQGSEECTMLPSRSLSHPFITLRYPE
jgi:hypothetical protein